MMNIKKGGLLLASLAVVILTSSNCQLSREQKEANKELVGVWKVYTVDVQEDKKYERSLVKFAQKSNGKLTAIIIDLRPSSQVGIDMSNITYDDGILTCELPDWGDKKTIFKGKISEDKRTITQSFEDTYPKIWMRVEDAETISLIQQVESSLESAGKRTYDYTVPDETGDGLLSADMTDTGMDQEKIAELVNRIMRGKYDDIHSLLIIKNGKLVLEEYFRVNGRIYSQFVTEMYRDRIHLLASSTKSITSTLIGIAIKKGFIKDVEAPVFEFFPEYDYLNNEQKGKIRLKHLLTMTAGLEWQQSNEQPRDALGMWNTEDVIKYYLEKPVVAEPGTEFTYSNGISTVLGAIIKNTSGMGADKFAEQYLFSPLGVADSEWSRYPDGTLDTDGSLALRPRDLAKIGLLFLSDGRWADKQILSEEWIRESTKKRVRRSESLWYGYQWWQRDFEIKGKTIESFHSWGWGGQYIFVFPALSMVVVSNAANFEYKSERYLFNMLETHILPAVVDQEPRVPYAIHLPVAGQKPRAPDTIHLTGAQGT